MNRFLNQGPKVAWCLIVVGYALGCDDDSARGKMGDAGDRQLLVDATQAGRTDATGSPCRLNSDCIPQLFCSDAGRCIFQCRENRDCLSERCVSGQCRPAVGQRADAAVVDSDTQSGMCAGDDDCLNEAEVCMNGACIQHCRISGCGPREICQLDTGVCADSDAGDCEPNGCGNGRYCDSDTGTCRPLQNDCLNRPCPASYGCRRTDRRCVSLPPDCVASSCPDAFECDPQTNRCRPGFDCNFDGCEGGLACDQDTGQCIDVPGDGALGDGCQRAADCMSGLCLDVTVENQNHVVCAKPCCSEFDCPLGFGCRDTMGIQVCLPSRIYPPGYRFDAVRGQACGPGARGCQSGLCDLGRDQCLGLCCTSNDCGGQTCAFRQVGQQARTICDAVPIGFGRTGQGCASEFDCLSGVCVPVPIGGAPGQCADLCCTAADCPVTTTCGQVVGLGGTIVSACVPIAPGVVPNGMNCLDDVDCQSGQCVERVCRGPCCRTPDCLQGQTCLPRPNDEGSLVRVCVPPGF
ncbi:MAG: hypothetical protein VYA30_06825 [Myxococcota bacterium]|nr:hypothetical protein [Myxococcota bacterium]